MAKLWKMVKVLFLNLAVFSQGGGIERFNKCLIKALSDLDSRQVTYSEVVSAYDTDIIDKYYPKEKYRGFAKKKILFSIYSIFKAIKFDTIILGHINLASIGVVIKKLFPKKEIILITHGIEVWNKLSGDKKQLLSVADKILCVSEFTKGKLLENNTIEADKIRIFPNTIDPFFNIPNTVINDNSLRSRYGLKDEDYVLFTLTRIADNETFKGYDNVILALSELVKAKKSIKYVLGGRYKEDEKERIERVLDKHGLKENVVFTGFIPENELVNHYQMADLYIMPSKKEGFGIVFIEALICGVPVVGGNADGSADALLHGKLGQLVDPDSIEDIRNAIHTAMNDEDMNHPTSIEKKKDLVVENYSFENYKKRLEKLLQDNKI